VLKENGGADAYSADLVQTIAQTGKTDRVESEVAEFSICIDIVKWKPQLRAYFPD